MSTTEPSSDGDDLARRLLAVPEPEVPKQTAKKRAKPLQKSPRESDVPEPLHYERPKAATTRPFWPDGWKPVEFVFLLFVFLGAALTDDYVAKLGWPRWLRMVGMAIVIYIGFWLSGRWRRPNL